MPVYEVHPANPQPRTIGQMAERIRSGQLIAYPTDSGFALGCQLGNAEALERIRRIRQLGPQHHFTLMVDVFAKLGQIVELDNWAFRAVKAATPGPYTFILPATREVPRMTLHPKKRTVGVRIPPHRTTLALLRALDEPLVSSTLILPEESEPLTLAREVEDKTGRDLDAILDSGDCGLEATTVVDLTGHEPAILRHGAGDPAPFE